MYCYVDESGNTGLELFDKNQPTLYYGVLTARVNLDVIAEPMLKELRKSLGVKRIHASELGVGRLTTIADKITLFSKKNDLRFSMLRVEKPDHAIISFFDQIFDSGMNKAVSWTHYFTPLRYPLLFNVAYLFDEALAKDAWKARRETNTARCAQMLIRLCNELIKRIENLPDARSRELISDALKWAASNPHEISYGVGNYDTALQIAPNLVGFQQVWQTIAMQSSKLKKRVSKITVDRQNEFNGAQGELADVYTKMRAMKNDPGLGPGMPTFDWSQMPEVPPTFTPGDVSAGLELVDVTLWITKRLYEGKPLSHELETLFQVQSKRGVTDEVSLRGIDRRWRHLLHLPDHPVPDEVRKHMEELEKRRKEAVASLECDPA